MFCSKRRVSGSSAETRGPRARIRRQTRALTPPGSRGCWGVTHCSTASRSSRTQASQNDAPIWKRRREDPRRPASLNLRDPTRGPGGRLNDLSWMREWPRSRCCHFLIGDGSRTRPATNVQIFFHGLREIFLKCRQATFLPSPRLSIRATSQFLIHTLRLHRREAPPPSSNPLR